MSGVILFNVTVGIPFLIAINLDKAHPAFDQGGRAHQTLGPERRRFGMLEARRAFFCGFGFSGQIPPDRAPPSACDRRVHSSECEPADRLHPDVSARWVSFEPGQQVELRPPGSWREMSSGRVRFRMGVRAGTETGFPGGPKAKKPVAPVQWTALGAALVSEHDVAGKILVFASRGRRFTQEPRARKNPPGSGRCSSGTWPARDCSTRNSRIL